MFNAGIRGKRANDNQGTVNPQTQFVQSKNPNTLAKMHSRDFLSSVVENPGHMFGPNMCMFFLLCA